jgi:AcrR family transcriptional regulator
MTATDRKAWERAQREKRIVDIAREIFVSRGYEGASVPAVADAAGYNKRTIYLYFKDKEEIFLAVVLRCLELLRDDLAAVAASAPEGRTDLKAFAWAFFRFSEQYPAYMDLIMVYESRHFVYHAADRPSHFGERHAACQTVSNEIADLATAAIEKGLQQGSLATDLAPRQLMLLLWGQIFGVIQILRIREKHFEGTFGLTRENLFDHFVKMVEKALNQ